jgi:hypothetical protein
VATGCRQRWQVSLDLGLARLTGEQRHEPLHRFQRHATLQPGALIRQSGGVDTLGQNRVHKRRILVFLNT